MKKFLILLLCVVSLTLPCRALEALGTESFDLPCRSAVLLERSTGTLLYAKNETEHLSPASVTKVMTMLLVCEAVENGSISLEDTVTASATAASMGGSQIWLEEGERMSVGEMLKCVSVVSANDCAVALAEYLCGSEAAFVSRMNSRAAELGLENTHFSNCTGLSSAQPHYTCARDVAVMSAELLSHDFIKNYSTLWMDTIRNGEFTLTNTNKLVHSYDGCTGLKTGFTSEAMFCLAASAEREGTEYVAVILHGDTSADRFAAARTLLDYAFANFTVLSLLPQEPLPALPVTTGAEETVELTCAGATALVLEKGKAGELQWELELPESVPAPVEQGQAVGTLTVRAGDEVLARLTLSAAQEVPRQSLLSIFQDLVGRLFRES